jgi:hypothetical protein
VVEKVPALSVTGWVTGSIAGAVLLKVKWDSSSKRSSFGLRSKSIASLALKARKGTPTGGGMMATPLGKLPTATVATTFVGGCVDHRNSARNARDEE